MAELEPGLALIVGNTDGIGLALTRRLLGLGWTVVGVSRRASSVAHASYEHVVADAAEPELRAAVSALQDQRGAFDVCVYCAGTGDAWDDQELVRASHVMRVNLLGVVETASVVVPVMAARGRGHFVALSSIGDTANPAAPTYSASKAGLSAWLDGLALALRPKGVRVTNLRLGFVDTKMAKAKVRPMMMSVERAVDITMSCLQKRPARRTYPLAMQVLVTLLALVTTIKLWFA